MWFHFYLNRNKLLEPLSDDESDSEEEERAVSSLPVWYKKRSTNFRSRDVSDYEEIESLAGSVASSKSDFEEIQSLKVRYWLLLEILIFYGSENWHESKISLKP